jgi:nitroreductase
MNELTEFLLTRRTVRAFQPKPVPEEVLADLLKTAKFSPSGMGLQGRHFTVIENQKLLSDIVAETVRHGGSFVPGHTPFYNAPAVLVVSAPKEFAYNREDAACAVMGFLFAAHAHGLASCYICSVLPGLNDPEILKALQLPEGYVPFGSVAFGYAEGEIPAPKARRTDDVTYLR